MKSYGQQLLSYQDTAVITSKKRLTFDDYHHHHAEVMSRNNLDSNGETLDNNNTL